MKKYFYSIFLLISLSALSAEDLVGSWRTDCIPGPGRHSSIWTSIYSDKEVVTVMKMFEDKECQLQTVSAEYLGAYKIIEANSENLTVDHTPEKIVLKLHTQSVVDYYNKNSVCGFSDWVLDDPNPKNVSGKFCSPFQMPTVDQTYFDLISLGDSELRSFMFPLFQAATLPAERPTTVENAVPFKRFQ